MLIFKTKTELKKFINESNIKLALVPTMGCLHEGHAKLIEEANKISNENCAVSIFVNPLQFNESKDFINYPRNLESDLEFCEKAKVKIVFAPSDEEMNGKSKSNNLLNQQNSSTPQLIKISIPELSRNLCGLSRPGHFEGVLHIVLRLLNLFQPKWAIFGKKDYQQYLIIKKMVEELEIPTEIIGIDTVRNKYGLAQSSRNVNLNNEAITQALLINRSLKLASKALAENKNIKPNEILEITKDVIHSGSKNIIDYVNLVNKENLLEIDNEENISRNKNNLLLAVAVFCDGVRLIDNLEL